MIDSKEFRRALGAFTTGVTVITARGADGRAVGVTANSFSSVSLDPPLVLWCLAKNAGSLPAFQETDYFAIHILSAKQEDVSRRFASRGEDKFSGIEVERGLGDTPLLDGCSTRMQCRKTSQVEGGDHVIFIGEVVDLTTNEVPPLVFHKGSYALAAKKADQAPLIQSEEAGVRDDLLGYLLWRAYTQFHAGARNGPEIARYTDHEFLTLLALIGAPWRTRRDIVNAMMLSGDDADVQKALSSLMRDGLVQDKKSASGSVAYGLTKAGKSKAIAILGEARASETEVLQKLGLGDGAVLKNILKRFIVETNPGLPQFWEISDDGAEEALC